MRTAGPLLLAWLVLMAGSPAGAGYMEDAKAALEAVADGLLGAPSGALSRPVAGKLAGTDPLYRQFSVAGVTVTEGEPLAEGGSAGGFVVLETPLRRRAVLRVQAQYAGHGEQLTVTGANLGLLPPVFPTVDVFLVPAGRNGPVEASPTLTEMLSRLAEAAVGPDFVDAEGGRYVIYAAVRERLEAGSGLWVRVAETADGLGTAPARARLFDFAGWRVATAEAELTVNAGPTRYIKVILQPGESAPEAGRIPRIIHIGTNQSPKPAAATAGPTKTVTPEWERLVEKLRIIEELRDKKLISDAEYQDLRQKALDGL